MLTLSALVLGCIVCNAFLVQLVAQINKVKMLLVEVCLYAVNLAILGCVALVHAPLHVRAGIRKVLL